VKQGCAECGIKWRPRSGSGGRCGTRYEPDCNRRHAASAHGGTAALQRVVPDAMILARNETHTMGLVMRRAISALTGGHWRVPEPPI